MKKGLYESVINVNSNLEDIVWEIRNLQKFRKRAIPKRCIQRTVLLKGLECEHAVILDAHLLDTKNLYVAMTRPSKKLTVISDSNIVYPKDMIP